MIVDTFLRLGQPLTTSKISSHKFLLYFFFPSSLSVKLQIPGLLDHKDCKTSLSLNSKWSWIRSATATVDFIGFFSCDTIPRFLFLHQKKKLELNQLSNDKKILEDPHWKANFLMIQFSKVLTGHLLPLPISCAVMLLRILHMYGCKYFKLMYRKAKTPWIH